MGWRNWREERLRRNKEEWSKVRLKWREEKSKWREEFGFRGDPSAHPTRFEKFVPYVGATAYSRRVKGLLSNEDYEHNTHLVRVLNQHTFCFVWVTNITLAVIGVGYLRDNNNIPPEIANPPVIERVVTDDYDSEK